MLVKDLWLVLWQAGILKEFPINPWGNPIHNYKLVKGELLILGALISPNPKIPMEIHITIPYPKAPTIRRNLCIILGTT